MRNPWIAIMRAAALGTGLRLTLAEIDLLAQDAAIEQCAGNDVERIDPSLDPINKGWALVNPRKYPVNPTLTLSSKQLSTPTTHDQQEK